MKNTSIVECSDMLVIGQILIEIPIQIILFLPSPISHTLEMENMKPLDKHLFITVAFKQAKPTEICVYPQHHQVM